MKSYKGFDKNLQCMGFQYEVGKAYEMPEEDVKVCKKGFHACESPLDVLNFYFLDGDCGMARFCEVEQSGELDMDDGGSTKVASSRIEVKAELKFADLVRHDYVRFRRHLPMHTLVAALHRYDDEGHRKAVLGRLSMIVDRMERMYRKWGLNYSR